MGRAGLHHSVLLPATHRVTPRPRRVVHAQLPTMSRAGCHHSVQPPATYRASLCVGSQLVPMGWGGSLQRPITPHLGIVVWRCVRGDRVSPPLPPRLLRRHYGGVALRDQCHNTSHINNHKRTRPPGPHFPTRTPMTTRPSAGPSCSTRSGPPPAPCRSTQCHPCRSGGVRLPTQFAARRRRCGTHDRPLSRPARVHFVRGRHQPCPAVRAFRRC